jgi:hypothetical protein
VRECSRVNPVADGLRVEPQHLGDLRDRQQLILPPLTDYRPSPPWIEHCRPSGTCRTPSTASTSAEHRAGRWAVKGAPSGVREAQAEGPTLTAHRPAPQSRRVVAGEHPPRPRANRATPRPDADLHLIRSGRHLRPLSFGRSAVRSPSRPPNRRLRWCGTSGIAATRSSALASRDTVDAYADCA